MIYNTSTNSIYCYPQSDVLINKFNIQENELLTQIETDITLNRLTELHAKPIKGKFDLPHLLKIHKYIFGDIFPFAGKTRNENIFKGNTRFCSCEHILENFNQLYSSLVKENFLAGLPLDQFCERLSYYMAELNMLHPFREGNGRTIREYIRCLALHNHHIINWQLLDKDCLIDAIIVSVTGNHKPLAKCILDALQK